MPGLSDKAHILVYKKIHPTHLIIKIIEALLSAIFVFTSVKYPRLSSYQD